MYVIGDTLARFACQPRLGLQARSPTTICGTYSLYKSAIFGLRLLFTYYFSLTFS